MLTNKAFRQRMAGLCTFFFVFGEMLSANPQVACAEENTAESDRIIVSLGDSYSSGEGIEPFYDQDLPWNEKVKSDDWLAHRSQNAWGGMLTLEDNGETIEMAKNRCCTAGKTVFDLLPESVSDKKTGHWYFAAVSGAVTNNIKETKEVQGENPPDGSQEKNYKKGYGLSGSSEVYEGTKYLTPQLDIFDELESRRADYVTLTIGGNDADFTGIVTLMALTSSYLTPNAISKKLEKVWDKFYEPSGIKENLESTYKRISEKAGSQAHIIVAGYPKLFYVKTSDHYLSSVIDRQEAEKVDSSVSRFNFEISKIVKDCREKENLNIEFVSVEEGFDGHEAYSPEPYINKIILGAKSQDLSDSSPVSAYSMHPNLKGAQIYANCVQKAIDNWEKHKSEQEQGADNDGNSVAGGTPFAQYVAAAQKVRENGAWSEKMNLEADVKVSQDRIKAKSKVTMNMDSEISNYTEDDLSQLEINSKFEMEAAKQKFAGVVNYHDGTAHYQFTEPNQKSYSTEMDPNIFNFKSVSQEAVLEEKISDGTICLLLDGDKAIENGLAVMQQMGAMNDLECGDIELIASLTDAGAIDQIEMNFDASLEYQGYDADASYKVTYTFTQ